MPTFDELSLQSTYPIIHSQRKDGAILTAIKVPIDDVRLERWGWILTLSHKDGSYNQDDIATLQDNSGQRYPKVYTSIELLHYIEKWGCDNWETGYNSNRDRMHLNRITVPLNTELLRREMLQETLEDIRNYQEEQTKVFNKEIALLNQTTAEVVFSQLTPHFTNIYGKQNQLFTFIEESRKRLDLINDRFTVLTEQTTEHHDALKTEIESLSKQIPTTIASKIGDLIVSIDERLDTIDQELKIQLSQIQSKTSRTIDDRLMPLTESSQKQLEAIDKEIKASLTQQSDQIKYLQDQIKKVLELTDLRLDDTDKAEDEDLAATANRIAKQPTTRIARIAASQLTIGNKYYDNVNEQSKRSFEIARRLSLIGGIVFIITIVVVIIADALHITHDSTLLPLGAAISGITELLAGLNFLYDKASKQFGRFHLFIDRIIRYSIAHAMTEEIKDPDQKQLNIEKIIAELLENDSRIKD